MDNASLVTLSPSIDSSTVSQYHELEQVLLELPINEPLFPNDLAPVDHLNEDCFQEYLFCFLSCCTNLHMAIT